MVDFKVQVIITYQTITENWIEIMLRVTSVKLNAVAIQNAILLFQSKVIQSLKVTPYHYEKRVQLLMRKFFLIYQWLG